ncbi:hypothetical protein FE810_10220 [Thalassotalea litorea]|uniref:Peptidase M10 metallopeptidase domain-containing protein n=1 Tax=Thalassotalea litorea TaxID=2020715 RepID=A0A5R9INL7_9GAMM|nr:matrixin family metalloprotease [Thalassotalea litorea]TLU64826.1 hypothetical protein FE810_10220 [Thalassotalea litorea]
MKYNRIRVTLLFMTLVLVLLKPATASQYYTCNNDQGALHWPDGVTTISLSDISFPRDSAFRNAAIFAINSWNNVIGSNLQYAISNDNSTSSALGDGINKVYFSDDLDSDTLGITQFEYYQSSCEFSEADISLNNSYSWLVENKDPSLTQQDLNSRRHNLQSVLVHEIGHMSGLDHETGNLPAPSNLRPSSPGPSVGYLYQRVPVADEIAGLRNLYTSDQSALDLAITLYQSSSNGRYNVPLPKPASTQIRQGKSIEISFVYLDLGNIKSNATASFYLLSSSDYDTNGFRANLYQAFAQHFISPTVTHSESQLITKRLVMPFSDDYPLGNYTLIIDIQTNANEADLNPDNNYTPFHHRIRLLAGDPNDIDAPDDEVPPASSEDYDNDGTDNHTDNDDDNDNVIDSEDAFPLNPLEWLDSDNDGVGDNSDAFPFDDSESKDSDNDGIGDNRDAFPFDASKTTTNNDDGAALSQWPLLLLIALWRCRRRYPLTPKNVVHRHYPLGNR